MKKNLLIIIINIFVILLLVPSISQASILKPIRIIVDGKEVVPTDPPIIENSRTLVPLRFISEELGADVQWINETRTVIVSKDNKSVMLKIDSQIIQYDNGKSYGISDIAPKIVPGIDRTFVPIRLIGNALGVHIDWDNENRSVIIDSFKTSEIIPFYDMKINQNSTNYRITGRTGINLELSEQYIKVGEEIRLLLMDRDSHTGFIVGKSKGTQGPVYYVPSLEENGEKILVAAIYDSSNNLIAADAIPVIIDVKPVVGISGVKDFEEYTDSVSVTPSINFNAHSVKYVFTNTTNGRVFQYDKEDPYLTRSFSPSFENQGAYTLQIIAYDHSFNEYKSAVISFVIKNEKKLSLGGVKPNSNITNLTRLWAVRNFNVNETRFILIHGSSGREEILKTIPYGEFQWFPGPEYAGEKQLIVEVLDTRNNIIRSNPVKVIVDGSPKIQQLGIGPDQVITGSTELKYRSNVNVEDVTFQLRSTSGKTRSLRLETGKDSVSFIPVTGDDGNWTVNVSGIYNGRRIVSETVNFRIYLGKIYGPTILVPKDQFQNFASQLARESFLKTGMSAAIQTSQAILETGWGQYVPTDKYSGKNSRNLFGIKGTGSNGFVISNTWEVYNGITYRIDDKFRAYNDPKESWEDHKALLLNAQRYGIFRDVMYDSTMGTWAIRRAGYATDPEYPLKLMDIIKRYNLKELDRIKL